MSEVLLTFGKYRGKSIEEVYEKDRNYLIWLSKQPVLKCISREVIDWLNVAFAGADKTTVLNFGKYKGKTIKHIWSVDTKYFEWLDRNQYVADSMPELKADIERLKEMESK